MSEPFIFVTTNAINKEELDRVNEFSTHFTELSNVQVHRDAASMDGYLPMVQQLIQQAPELTKTTSIEVYGTPGPVAQQVLRTNAEQEVRVRVKPDRISGFVRPTLV
jgi:hypothetical protein